MASVVNNQVNLNGVEENRATCLLSSMDSCLWQTIEWDSVEKNICKLLLKVDSKKGARICLLVA